MSSPEEKETDDMLEAAIYTELAIICGFILDLVIGDPEKLAPVHPVVLMGKCISFLEKHLRRVFREDEKSELTAGAVIGFGGCALTAPNQGAYGPPESFDIEDDTDDPMNEVYGPPRVF